MNYEVKSSVVLGVTEARCECGRGVQVRQDPGGHLRRQRQARPQGGYHSKLLYRILTLKSFHDL